MKKPIYLKAALVVPKMELGKPLANAQELIQQLDMAKKAQIVLFPEMTLTGYALGDWIYNADLYEQSLEALKQVVLHTKEQIVVLGSFLEIDSSYYNVAFVIQNQKILGIVPKQYLPVTNEFVENRYFNDGHQLMKAVRSIQLFGQEVPVGPLLFQDALAKITFGVEICGDLWSPLNPHGQLYMSGADIVLNPSSSPYHIGKSAQRTMLVQAASLSGQGSYLYVSTGPSETSSNFTSIGHVLACSLGEKQVDVETLDFASQIVYADIDLEAIHHARKANNWSGSFCYNPTFATIPCHFNALDDYALEQFPSCKPFVVNDEGELTRLLNVLCAALYKRLTHINTHHIVIGMSGGVDSTLALLLACLTFDKYHISRENICGLTLPSKVSSADSASLAKTLGTKLGITMSEIAIGEEVERHLQLLAHDNHSDVTFENTQARYRTMLLMNKANQVKGIVLGTGDMSEIALGWSTFNGDQMSMYNLNAGIPKTMVQHLVLYLRCLFPKIETELTTIVNNLITPELTYPAVSTESVIGQYEINDFIMYHLFKYGASQSKLLYLLVNVFGISFEEASLYYERFVKRFKMQHYKRIAAPECLKVYGICFDHTSFHIPGDLN